WAPFPVRPAWLYPSTVDTPQWILLTGGTPMTVVELTWLGQAGFLLDGSGVKVLVDAFLSPMPQRRIPPPVDPSSLSDIDLILCPHEHWDHLDWPTVAAVCTASARARVAVPAPVTALVRDAGVPADRVDGATPYQALQVGGLTVTPVPACHGVDVADA